MITEEQHLDRLTAFPRITHASLLVTDIVDRKAEMDITIVDRAQVAEVMTQTSPLRDAEQIKQRVRALAAQYEISKAAQEHDDAVRKLQRMSELVWVLYPQLDPMTAPAACFWLIEHLRKGGAW